MWWKNNLYFYLCVSTHVCVRSCMCLCLPLQIYEDSIVIKSVFESARQRIVTDEDQKETVSASHSDNGGRAEEFVPSAGESWNTNIRMLFYTSDNESKKEMKMNVCWLFLVLQSDSRNTGTFEKQHSFFLWDSSCFLSL